MPETIVAVEEDLSRALDALQSLPQCQRDVLHLFAVENLSAVEISEVLSISRDNVKANLSLARRKMREHFPELSGEARPSDV